MKRVITEVLFGICFNDQVLELQFLFKNHGDGDADEDESWHNVEFSSENVHLIATGEEWEEKMEEAKKDDKIVSHVAILLLSLSLISVDYIAAFPNSLVV